MTDILKIPANSQAYLFAVRNAASDKFDVKKFAFGYTNSVPFSAAWGYWKMEETAGNRVDSSGNNRDGVPSGSGTTGYEAVKLGNGVTFNRYAYLNVSEYLDLTEDAHALISFWFKIKSGGTASYGLILDADIQIYTIMDGGGKFHLDAYTHTYSLSASSASLDLDVLYFGTVYYNGTGLYIEINNAPSGSALGSSDLDSTRNLLYIGNFGGTSYTGITVLDEFGIWIGVDADAAIARRAELWNSGAGWSPY